VPNLDLHATAHVENPDPDPARNAIGSADITVAVTGPADAYTIGDAYAPGTIANAVWDGRRYAEELDGEPHGDAVPFRREVVELAPLGEEVSV